MFQVEEEEVVSAIEAIEEEEAAEEEEVVAVEVDSPMLVAIGVAMVISKKVVVGAESGVVAVVDEEAAVGVMAAGQEMTLVVRGDLSMRTSRSLQQVHLKLQV